MRERPEPKARDWRTAAFYAGLTVSVALTSGFLFFVGAISTSALAGIDAGQKLENRLWSAGCWCAAVAVFGVVPWKASSDGHRGPWRAVALTFVAGGVLIAATTIAGITVPN